MTPDPATPAQPGAPALAVALSTAGTAGALVMAVAHPGVDLPLLPTVGAGRPVPPAAAAFGVGTVLFALTTIGLWRGRAWSWALGLAVNALAFTGAASPYRGIGSAVGMAVAGAIIVLLLLPSTRARLLGGRRAPDSVEDHAKGR